MTDDVSFIKEMDRVNKWTYQQTVQHLDDWTWKNIDDNMPDGEGDDFCAYKAMSDIFNSAFQEYSNVYDYNAIDDYALEQATIYYSLKAQVNYEKAYTSYCRSTKNNEYDETAETNDCICFAQSAAQNAKQAVGLFKDLKRNNEYRLEDTVKRVIEQMLEATDYAKQAANLVDKLLIGVREKAIVRSCHIA